MIPPLHGFRLLLVLLALGAAGAAVCGDAALAQQTQTPTELWEEYPLDPEGSPQQPESGTQQGSGSGAGPAKIGGDEGGAVPATDDARFPLIPILVTIGILLFVLIPGVGVWAVGGCAPERLRDRIGAVRLPSFDRQRPLQAVSWLRKEFLEHRSRWSWSPALFASREQKDTNGSMSASGLHDPARVKDKRAKLHKPKPRPPAQKKKPPAPKPPAKAQPAAKPPAAAKPRQAAKSQRPAKPRQAKAPQGAKPRKPGPPAKRKRPAERRASSAPTKPVLTEALKPKAPDPEKPVLEPVAAREELQLVAADTVIETKLTCSIFGWRDGMVADFYALASGLQGHDWIVERSPRFAWQGGDVPPEAHDAHAILVDALIQAGWRHVGSEGVWYRQRFERPVERGDLDGSEP